MKKIKMTTEQKIKQLDLEIELLKKEKEKSLLQQEIEKIKKTKIEEITIERRIIVEPCYPVFPPKPIIC